MKKQIHPLSKIDLAFLPKKSEGFIAYLAERLHPPWPFYMNEAGGTPLLHAIFDNRGAFCNEFMQSGGGV